MFRELLRPYTKEIRKYFIFSCIYVTFDVIILATVNTVLAKVLPAPPDARYFMLFITTMLAAMIFYLHIQKRGVRLIETLVGDTRERIIQKVRSAELESYEKLGKSHIYNAITLDTQIISEVVGMFMTTTECTLLSIGLLVYIALVSWPSFLFTAGVLGCGGLIYTYQIIRIRKWLRRAREKEKELFAATDDLISGFKELRVNDRKSDDFFHSIIKVKSSENREYRTKSELMFVDANIASTFMELMIFIPILFILPVFGGLSNYALMASVTALLFLPTVALKETIPYLIRTGVSMEQIGELEKELKKVRVEKTPPVSGERITRSREIRYNQISFAYTDRDGNPLFGLDNISFSVHPGEILFIVGGNGSGKSTLLKVMTGLYRPFSGSIEIDGSEVEMAEHRYLFSAIFSDFHLFDRLYGLPDIDKNKVDEWIRLMQLDDKLEFRENRFSTLDLSTGQRKRLALIAAMMEDKPIYIFDEWAADQSPRFREFFYTELLPQFKAQGKTVIAVSHDDRYFHVADRVLKLDYGHLTDGE